MFYTKWCTIIVRTDMFGNRCNNVGQEIHTVGIILVSIFKYWGSIAI